MALLSVASVRCGAAQPPALPPKPDGQPTQPAGSSDRRAADSFEIVIDPGVQGEPFTGRVYVIFAPDTGAPANEPRRQMGNWFNPPRLVSLDVTAAAAGRPILIAADTPGLLSFPEPLAAWPARGYRVQAVARRNLDAPSPGAAGDAFSEVAIIDWPGPANAGTADKATKAEGKPVRLKLAQTVGVRAFRETETVKLLEVESKLLSAHYGRSFKLRAGVSLPDGWKPDGNETYPVVYAITGFGGTHHDAGRYAGMFRRGPGGREGDAAAPTPMIVVVPDASCGLGHSVFADSANNGPWGRALMEELIPAVDRQFRGGGPTRRYVTGISSGGWSSLWLQITYPDQFNGVWSHVPDPVDFRDFQRINLYATDPPSNMYRDEKGERRPLARRGDSILLHYDRFVAMEEVLGPGGQIHSFEAVFSPRGADGKPVRIFNRETGQVDPAKVKAWEPYDIRLVLERNWATLGPKLKGKLHVYAGELDTFYLEGAVRLLGESLSKLGSDAEVVVRPGMAHSADTEGIRKMVERIAANEAELKIKGGR